MKEKLSKRYYFEINRANALYQSNKIDKTTFEGIMDFWNNKLKGLTLC